jgi:hypothetical protein
MRGTLPGTSASPCFCLSDFVKNWPSKAENQSGRFTNTAEVEKHVMKKKLVILTLSLSKGKNPRILLLHLLLFVPWSSYQR